MLPTILYASLFASLFAAVAITASHDGFDLLPIDLTYSISLGIFQIGLGFLLFTLGARHLPAVELNLLSLTEIIVGPILVWIVIGEIPINSTLIGGASHYFRNCGHSDPGSRTIQKRPDKSRNAVLISYFLHHQRTGVLLINGCMLSD